MKNIGIARQPVRLAKSLVADEDFNFVTTNDFGLDNVIEVAKTDVFAHQIADGDVAKIQDMESREGKYDDSYKVAGNWMCTATGCFAILCLCLLKHATNIIQQ